MGFACRALVVRVAWLVIISPPLVLCQVCKRNSTDWNGVGQERRGKGARKKEQGFRRHRFDTIRQRFDTALGRHIVETTVFTCCLVG